MALKDVLVTLMSYPEATSVSAVEEAVRLAAALGAGISAIAYEVKIQTPGRVHIADALLNVPAMIAAEAKKSAANARDLLAAFEAAAKKSGIFQEKFLERCSISEIPDLLVGYARLRDATIIPVSAGEHFDPWYAESIIFGSGRPTIVLPETPKHTGAAALNTVVVAWDFSRSAARAIADALPILQQAKLVRAVTVTSEKVIGSLRTGAELAKHLARHGVKIELDTVDAAGRSIGDVLESYVTSNKADFLVMGAYGHSRIREFILGGATMSMLSRPPLPILLSH